MTKLKTAYDKKEEVPEKYLDLYSERAGKWELSEVEGMKSQADIDRLSEALRKEKGDHRATKDQLLKFKDLDDLDAVMSKLDEYDELKAKLEAGAGGKFDEQKFEEAVAKRLKREMSPVERERNKLNEKLQKLSAERDELSGFIIRSTIEANVRSAAEKNGIRPHAIDDVVMIGSGIFEVTEDGKVVTKDSVGVTPGVAPDVWLTDMKTAKPHWWPESVGGGARGSNGSGGGVNPWHKDSFNLTEQGRYIREHGLEKAGQMAKAAGVDLAKPLSTAKK